MRMFCCTSSHFGHIVALTDLTWINYLHSSVLLWWHNDIPSNLWYKTHQIKNKTWWRHQMETFSVLLAFVREIHRWIPLTKASDAELWFFFDLRLDKRLSKQSWGWWFETPPCPLWRHCNDKMFLVSSCSCLCPIHWIQMLSREWRCCWSSVDRRCSNYIWVYCLLRCNLY